MPRVYKKNPGGTVERAKGKSLPIGRPAKFTPALQAKFLAHYRKTANQSLSCEAVGVSGYTVILHRKANPEFDKAFLEAREYAMDMLEGEARRRAFSGTPKPVFYKGKQVGEVKEYSDLLLIFLLKANRPEKYREKTDVNYQGSITIEVKKFGEESVDTKQLAAKARSVAPLALLGTGRETGSGSGTPKVG